MRAESIIVSPNIQNLQCPRRSLHWLGLWAAFAWLCALALGAAPVGAQPEYLLAPGDILKITVFKNADLSLDVRVSETGAIGYPLIGSVPLKGLTLPAAEAKIAQMLRDGGFVVNPQVNILLTEGFGNLVSVIGEVNKPGRYSTDAAGGHVSGMLAAAGGVASPGRNSDPIRNAKRQAFSARCRHREDGLYRESGRRHRAIRRRHALCHPRAHVLHLWPSTKTRSVPLQRGMTVIQALATGGGVTGKGTQRGIVRHRRDANGKVKEEGVSMDDDVQDRDVIYVKESLF